MVMNCMVQNTYTQAAKRQWFLSGTRLKLVLLALCCASSNTCRRRHRHSARAHQCSSTEGCTLWPRPAF